MPSQRIYPASEILWEHRYNLRSAQASKLAKSVGSHGTKTWTQPSGTTCWSQNQFYMVACLSMLFGKTMPCRCLLRPTPDEPCRPFRTSPLVARREHWIIRTPVSGISVHASRNCSLKLNFGSCLEKGLVQWTCNHTVPCNLFLLKFSSCNTTFNSSMLLKRVW